MSYGKYQPHFNDSKNRWEVIDITSRELIAHFAEATKGGRGKEMAEIYADKLNGKVA